MSASGASKNAKAMSEAQARIRREEKQLYAKWDTNLNNLIDQKTDKLLNLGDIFERFNSTGAFGDNIEVVDNLRQAQLDFSRLAAGDFSGFDNQITKTLSDYSIATIGSGAPIGTYASLSADAMMNYRLQGIQTTSGISDFFSAQANNLLGLEFGVMDQGFQVGYELDRSKQNAVNATLTGQAATAGVSQQAWGGALQTTGSLIAGAYTGMQGMSMQQQSLDNQTAQLNKMGSQAGQGRTNVAPISLPSLNLNSPNVPDYTSAGYPDNVFTNGTPIDELVYRTPQENMPGEDIGVLQPIPNSTGGSPQYIPNSTGPGKTNYLSNAASSYMNAMTTPFTALYSLGAQIASGYKKQ